MDDQQKQLVAKLKDAQNVLVTVSKNPTVDQLAAAIGLTLALNKLDKHATAVYSGQTPSTIEFLKPEETLESNTDSLRDFIIALDKSKADKLRYKVEDQVVRIFITPYRTSITENDLDFSQGDFNVDVVVALGVKEQTDLDEAISAHGRILHDATVSTVSIDGPSELGTLNIVNTGASSLCELTTKLVSELGKDILDAQIATALLTGIVAMTDRFSNDRTTPDTMSLSATLMSAGANQQLIANELAEAVQTLGVTESRAPAQDTTPKKDPGTLEISHGSVRDVQSGQDETPPDSEAADPDNTPPDQSEVESEVPQPKSPQIHVDEEGKLVFAVEQETAPQISKARAVGEENALPDHEEPLTTRERVIEPPSRTGSLTANTQQEELDAPTEELTLPPLDTPLLSHEQSVLPASDPVVSPQMDAPSPVNDFMSPEQNTAEPAFAEQSTSQEPLIDTEEQTLTDIEKAVGSPHVQQNSPEADQATNVDDARSAVEAALASAGSQSPADPIVALNAQPLGGELHAPENLQTNFQPAPGFETLPSPAETLPGETPADQTLDMPLPSPSGAVFEPGVISPNQDGAAAVPPPPSVPPPPIFPNA